MDRRVKIAFASATADLIPAFLDRFSEIAPGLELLVVSEFPPGRGRWIPYRVDRSLGHNLRRIRAALGNSQIEFAATILQPNAPYRAMRWLPFLLAPHRTLIYNTNLDHFTLRPQSLPQIGGHFYWRLRETWTRQSHPGGDLYTWLWRIRHPRELRRPVFTGRARLAGARIARQKARLAPRKPHLHAPPLPSGLSLVIPSRNGRYLLDCLMPLLERELTDFTSEVIVVDNGSDDSTVDWLRTSYPHVRVEHSTDPLSFARAVNRGVAAARFDKVCLLNNDMEPHDGFFRPLLEAFMQVPDLFCATAQILFPEGRRREETGKALMRRLDEQQTDAASFPVYCANPIPGENLSYVLYGSGGCSLYDTAKLRALGSVGEVYEPAYVEDLDIGVRAWQAGWPTVFVAKALVTHQHRATTSRYYTADDLDRVLEVNYLRFLARTIGDPSLFLRLWRQAIKRLTYKAAIEHHQPSAAALELAWQAPSWIEPPIAPEQDPFVLAIGSGDVAVFPGRAGSNGPVVLIATCYTPFPLAHGGAVRMYNLMRRAAPDFRQVLITFVDELHTPPAELLDLCVEIVQVRRVGTHLRQNQHLPDVVQEFESAAFRAALRLTVRKWSPSLAQLEFTQMAQYAEDCAPARMILVEHDITIDLYRQLLREQEDLDVRQQLETWTRFERSAWRQVDAVVVMSEKDQRMVEGAKSCVALPNGVDLERFRPSAAKPDPSRLLFIGSFAHLPNLLALDFFLTKVWPHLHALRLVLHVIAGARHQYFYERSRDRLQFRLDHSSLELEDFVSDVRPAYEKAVIVIAPLLASAGTNIKIMEAMAMGKVVVSTTGGVNGLNVQSGVDIVVEDDPCRMAEAIEGLLADTGKREVMERQARKTVERLYDWDAIATRQKELYDSLLAPRPGSSYFPT